MPSEQAVRQVLERYLHAGLIEGDVDAVLSLISDDIFGFGMGEQGFVASKEDVRNVMQAGVKVEEDVSYRVECGLIDIRFPAETVANLCAKVHIYRRENSVETQSGLLQSLTLRLESGAWKITALHAAPILLTEESIESYPLRFADEAMNQLRADLQSEAFSLMNQSIPGGILGTYTGNADAYPLYFVNDGMLVYLGYTREEFVGRFQGDVLEIVYPEDRGQVNQMCREAMLNGSYYEGRFRVVKKDGGILWMVERGHKSTDEAGREVLLGVFVDVSELVNMQQELREQANELAVSEERFRIALEKTSNIIFDYNIASGSIVHSSIIKKSMDFVTNIRDAQSSLIIGGNILPEYMEQFTHAFSEIENGAARSNCVVKVRLASGRDVWNEISMTAVNDEHSCPVRAIGMIEDITRQKEAEQAFIREEQFRQALLTDIMAAYVVNFSNNCFESCQVSDPRCVSMQPGTPYDELISKVAPERMSVEDSAQFINKFSLASVIDAFSRRRSELRMEYFLPGIEERDGVWMQTILRLTVDTYTEDKKGFLYVTDISAKKKETIELTEKSEQDQMTGTYNKISTEQKVNERIEWLGKEEGVFFMIDVDHFKDVNDTYGHPFGDTVLVEASRRIRSIFRDIDIIGRLGGDEFCVFYSGAQNRERIVTAAEKIGEIFREIHTPDTRMPVLSCSIGIAFCNGSADSFEQIYRRADETLYRVKRSGRNGYAFADENQSRHFEDVEQR